MGKVFTLIFIFTCMQNIFSQDTEKKLTVTAGEGIVVAGYVNNGGYINFTGPSLKLTHKPHIIWLGVLPSLRIKNDQVPEGAKKNSPITPSLGIGLTWAYKHVAVQLPAYYNTKTATSNGLWHVGIGVGYKF